MNKVSFIEGSSYYVGDCIEAMQDMKKKNIKVDLTVTSPPYDNLRTYNNTLEWNFDKFKKIAQLLYDVTSDGGIVVWVVGDATLNGSETGSSFKQALYFMECGFKLQDEIVKDIHKYLNICLSLLKAKLKQGI